MSQQKCFTKASGHKVLNAIRTGAGTAHAPLETEAHRQAAVLADAAVCRLTLDGVIDSWNISAEKLFGYSGAEAIGHPVTFLVPPEQAEEITADIDLIKRGVTVRRRNTMGRRKDGAFAPVSFIAAPICEAGGQIMGVSMLVCDITERKQAEEELRQAAAVFEGTHDGVMITDAAGSVIAVNSAFSQITGYAREEILGKSPRLLQSGRHDKTFYQDLWRSITEKGCWQGEIWNRRKNGEVYPQWLTISSVKNADGLPQNYIGVFADITPLRRVHDQLEYQAHHDPLTQLPNRQLFMIRLEEALRQAESSETQAAVLFLDLDHFKEINDHWGHHVGDVVLKETAERLRKHVRRGDTVARLGGDEFVVLLSGLRNCGPVAHVARKLIAAFTEPLQAAGREMCVGASVGASVFPRDGRDAERLLRHADAAMYRAKATERGSFAFYGENLFAPALKQAAPDEQIQQAAAQGRLVLCYRPEVEIAGGRLLAIEAKPQWRRPKAGLPPPGSSTSFARALGEWALRSACAQAGEWRKAGLDFGRVTIEATAEHLKYDHFVTSVRNVLEATELPPERLELEISETLLAEQEEQIIPRLEALRDLGAALTLSDFGAGRASLACLKRLPLDRVKLDRGVMRDLLERGGATIAHAMIALGHGLGFAVIAEGVETESQRDFLLAEGCEGARGSLYAPALPSEKATAALRRANWPR